MRRDGRLSMALHALLHMAEVEDGLTSEELARRLDTNAVVVRRTLAGLREAGWVRSEKGHGGGWTLARRLEDITVADVYAALGIATLFAVGPRTESPGCLVEQAVNRAMSAAMRDAETIALQRLRAVTLADLAAEARRRTGSTKPFSRKCSVRKGASEHG